MSEVDAALIPTGLVVGVKGTPLDLTTPTRLGEVVIDPTEFPAVFFTFFPFDICHEAQTTDKYKYKSMQKVGQSTGRSPSSGHINTNECSQVLNTCPGGEYAGFSHTYVIEDNVVEADDGKMTEKVLIGETDTLTHCATAEERKRFGKI